VQEGGVVVPRAVAEGADVRGPAAFADPGRPSFAEKVEGPDAADLCAFPEETPAGVYTGLYTRGSEFPRRGTIYMNYTGGVLQGGGENSAENQSTLAKSGHEYPVYTGGEERAIAVAQAVQADFEDWAVRVVYLKRPPKLLPYVMIMMGGHWSDTYAGPSGGVAPGADCEDLGLRNVCYAFVNNDAATSSANVASQEIGHTMGLGHTFGGDRVMAFGYDAFSAIDMGFGDECTQVLVAQGQSGYCAGVNKCHCASDGLQQHDKRTLGAIFAPAGPDTVPPTIEITGPADGTVYDEGAVVTIDVLPWDDFGGYGWQITIRDAEGADLATIVDYEASQQFILKGIPAGAYTIVAEVQDHSDQVGSDEIQIFIGDPPAVESTGEAPTTGEAASTGSSGADPGGSSDASGEDPPQDGVDGCSCAARDVHPLALLGLLGFARRRRR
jgi:MYXO-CTERM domain-containing protein